MELISQRMYPGSEVSRRSGTLVRARIAIAVALTLCGGLLTASATNVTHWAFQPVVRPSPPKSKYSNVIDAFVSSAIKEKRHTLAAEADRRTLIRRLSFDLRGLPPAPEEIAGFLKDNRQDAYERLVETFL